MHFLENPIPHKNFNPPSKCLHYNNNIKQTEKLAIIARIIFKIFFAIFSNWRVPSQLNVKKEIVLLLRSCQTACQNTFQLLQTFTCARIISADCPRISGHWACWLSSTSARNHGSLSFSSRFHFKAQYVLINICQKNIDGFHASE